MRTFLATNKKNSKQTMLFKYNQRGYLMAFELNFVPTDARIEYVKDTLPWTIAELSNYKGTIFRVEEIKQDLSFDAFWDAYKHKVGNKTRAKKLWEALSANDKAKAINYIKRYNDFLMGAKGIQKLYPETYLYQKRFNNE